MCSDGDTWSIGRPRPVLPLRKRFYRRLGQMFLRWAETNSGRD